MSLHWFNLGVTEAKLPVGGVFKILRAVVRMPDGAIQDVPSLRINGADVPRAEYTGYVLAASDELCVGPGVNVEVGEFDAVGPRTDEEFSCVIDEEEP